MSWPPPSWNSQKWRGATNVPTPFNHVPGHLPRPPMFMPKPVSALRTETPPQTSHSSHGYGSSAGVTYGSIHSLEEESLGQEGETNKEELFPLGKKSEFQKDLESSPGSAFIGLEYVIEIQHNTSKKANPAYACLLCDSNIKNKEGSASTLDLIKSHVRSSAHKLSYLAKFFPTLKAKKIDIIKPVDHIMVNGIIERIIQHLGSMQVKLVIGHKLFKKKAPEIKLMVDKSSHHSENPIVLKLLFPHDSFDTSPSQIMAKDAIPKPVPCRRPNSPEAKPESMSREKSESKSKLDDYADIFEEFERAQREQGTLRSPDMPDQMRPIRKMSSDDELQIIQETSRKRSSSPKRSRRRTSRSRSKDRGTSSRRDRSSRKRTPDRKSSQRRSRSPKRRSRSPKRRSRSPNRRSRGKEESSKRSRSPRRSARDRRSREPISRSQSPRKSPVIPINPRTGKPFSTGFFETKQQKVNEFHEALKDVTLEHELKRDHFIEHASLHPEYTRRWNRFYRDKQREHQSLTIHMDYLKDEWAHEWRKFVVSEFEKSVKEDRNRLMNKFKIFHADLKEYEDFQQMGAAHILDPGTTSRAVHTTSIDQVGQSGANEMTTHAKSTISSHAAPKVSTDQGSANNEVSVISTLRLLSALESLLDYLGPEINVSLGKANSLEVNKGYGASASMINDSSFFTLIDSARENLQFKMDQNIINQQQLKVSKICIDNIHALMQLSTCTKPEGIEKPRSENLTQSSSAPMFDDKSDPLKEVITKTVIKEYRKMGREISGSQLNSIVEAQYERIKGQMVNRSSPKPALIPAPVPSFEPSRTLATSNPQPLFQGYATEQVNPKPKPLQVNWDALQSALLTATSITSGSSQRVSYQPEGTTKEVENTDDDTDFDDLTLEDLTSLFKNFKDLDQENQKNLIEYMKRIEKSNPSKVTELKRHIHGNGT